MSTTTVMMIMRKKKMRDYNIEGPQHKEYVKIGVLLNKKNHFEYFSKQF